MTFTDPKKSPLSVVKRFFNREISPINKAITPTLINGLILTAKISPRPTTWDKTE